MVCLELIKRVIPGTQEIVRIQAQYAELARSALDEIDEGPAVEALGDAIAYAVDRRR